MRLQNKFEFKKNERGNDVLTVPVEIKAIHEEKQDGEEFFVFEAYGSTFGNIDLVDDIVAPGAFEESIRKETPVILWQHDRFEPIGMPTEIREDNIGLFLKVRMPKDDVFVSGRVMPQLRIGSVKAMSIGFRVVEASFNEETGIRTLLRVDLKEVSLVTFPANPAAVVTDVKTIEEYDPLLPFAKRDYVWDESSALGRVKAHLKDSEKTHCYMLHVRGDGPILPYMDIVDENLVIVPQALKDIRRALSGAKGKLDITPEQRKQISKTVEKYIDRLDDEQPKSFYDVECIRNLTARELEKCLRESNNFSKDAAVLIASKFHQGEPDTSGEAATIAKSIVTKMEKSNVDNEVQNKLNSILEKFKSA